MMSKRKGSELPKNPIGRPDKFTPERRSAIIQSISDKIPYVLAAEANGICEDTLYEWIKRGMNDLKNGIESEYATFSEIIKKTEQEKIRKLLFVLEENPERWQSTAWILERRWWKLFSSSAAVIEFNRKLEKLEHQGGKHNVKALKSEAEEVTEK